MYLTIPSSLENEMRASQKFIFTMNTMRYTIFMEGYHTETREKLSLNFIAEKLQQKYTQTQELVSALHTFIHSLKTEKVPASIIESRFTDPEYAYEIGMLSCGIIANIATKMLRHIGFQVKLVHGETEESVDHAWISVLQPETVNWIDIDLTQDDPYDLRSHIEKGRVDSWEEIRPQIESEHNSRRERVMARENQNQS